MEPEQRTTVIEIAVDEAKKVLNEYIKTELESNSMVKLYGQEPESFTD